MATGNCYAWCVGIYLRVSTDSQTTENQRRELGAVAVGEDRILARIVLAYLNPSQISVICRSKFTRTPAQIDLFALSPFLMFQEERGRELLEL